jgi:hypothetical protein
MTAPQRESLNTLFEEVVGAAYEVSNTLGAGFLEKVYERALAKELSLRGIPVRPQVPYKILYKGHVISEYIADLVVDESLLNRSEVRQHSSKRTPSPDPKLSKSLQPPTSPANQLPTPESGMATSSPQLLRFALICVHSRPIRSFPGFPTCVTSSLFAILNKPSNDSSLDLG